MLLFCLPFNVGGQNICGLSISADFEPRCLVTTEKPTPYEELADELIACQGMTVTYKATANTGGDPVVSWVWSVTGASAWTDLGGGRISVTWGDGPTGLIVLSIDTEGGTSCSLTRDVQLIASPTAAAATVPAFQVDANGDKVIYVCSGGDVEFSDVSHAGDKDIVGYHWESFSSSSSTRNYTLKNILADDEVVHRVYNECGCYDKETFQIVVLQGEDLALECYGTACQYDVVTYVATTPSCDNFYWSVDGGTIVDGQHTDSLTIQWDRPQNGYGVISLDGISCGDNVCPAMLSRKIPVIHDTVPVEGKTEVCVGEGVVYSVPLWGATEYNWSVTPSSGVIVSDMNGANKKHVEFHNAGTYKINVVYRCDFLGCGPYYSKTLMVNVKPPLRITGRDKICSGNSCKLTTEAGVPAQWTAYDIATGQAVGAASGQTVFSMVFLNTGKYRIVAEHNSYCVPGEFILTVLDPPPAPVLGDMAPSNPTIACTGSSIRLAATPSTPGYSFVWKPECTSASPASVSGDDVTINYGNEVCNVKVYNYDRKLECLSTGYYTHSVQEFVLLQHNLPPSITVCPGAEIVFGSDKVPYQNGVLYRWTIEDDKQHCASVIGSALGNTVRILVNDISGTGQFKIYLKRSYCTDQEEVAEVTVYIGSALLSQLTIGDISPVCVGDQVTLSGSGCIHSYPQWEVDGVRILSNTYTASSPGEKRVKMICNPFTFCEDESYYSVQTGSFRVNPPPYVRELVYNPDNTVGCRPNGNNLNYSYIWKFGNNVISTNNTAPYLGDGSYTLELTDNTTGCTMEFEQYVDNFHYPADDCGGLEFTGESYSFCDRRYSVTVSDPHHQAVHWTIEGGGYSNVQTSYSYNEHLEVTLNSVGTYIFTAYTTGDPCYRDEKTFTLDFIPDFSFVQQCNAIVIHNNSQYLDGTRTVTIRFNNSDYTFPLSVETYTIINVAPGIYPIRLMKYGSSLVNGSSGCDIGTATLIPMPHTLTITTANSIYNTYTCNNTPIQLTATMSDDSRIQSTTWSFSDGSSIRRRRNTVYHTFGYDEYHPDNNTYNVTATVKDEVGCDVTGSISITSFKDEIISGVSANKIQIISSNPVCPNTTPVELQYSGTPATPASYNWTYPDDHNSTYDVFHTDDYYLYLEDAHYCKAEARKNVGFLNKPQANIVTERTFYCLGETIALYGAPDPDSNDYTFLWTITDPLGATVTKNTATAFFTANLLGNYSVHLEINNSSCSDDDTRTIPVGTVPPAPTVAFGSNKCIHTPPVLLSATAAATNDILWSNGNSGPVARYYSPGFATAFYYDPATGCRSVANGILIEEQPDFDGLLTGCYVKCDSQMQSLPVYGLTTEQREISWAWYNNSSIVDQDNNTPYVSPLLLPLPYYGDYHLSVVYQGNACIVESPTLSISSTDYCLCDSLDFDINASLNIVDCIVTLDISFDVVNNTQSNCNFTSFTPLFDNQTGTIVSTTFTPQTIAPGQNYMFTVKVIVERFLPSGLRFELEDIAKPCKTVFVVDLMQFVDCERNMTVNYNINEDISNSVAAYLEFFADITPAQSLLAFWSEPPMVIDYLFDNVSLVSGLLMLDIAVLSQMAAAGEEICFYAIVCEKDKLCKYKYCIDAEKLYSLLQELEFMQKSGDSTNRTEALINDNQPYLVPNPAQSRVSIAGYESSIVDIAVMDMNGRHIAAYYNTDSFDATGLPSGIYIVRVITRNTYGKETVVYLKLIKK